MAETKLLFIVKKLLHAIYCTAGSVPNKKISMHIGHLGRVTRSFKWILARSKRGTVEGGRRVATAGRSRTNKGAGGQRGKR